MSSDKLITLAISMPYAGTSWPAGEGVSPALLKAINSVNADPLILPDHTLTWFWYDTQCDPVYAGLGKTVLDSFFPHAFIGPACSTVVAELIDEVYGHPLTGVPFDRPLISWGAGNAMFADKDKYPMFSRVVASYAGHNNAVVALANQYGWDKLGILATSDSLWGTTLKLLKQDLFALDAEMVRARANTCKSEARQSTLASEAHQPRSHIMLSCTRTHTRLCIRFARRWL